GWFRRTHGRAREQSRLDPRRPVVIPWRRRVEARGVKPFSCAAKHSSSAPAQRGAPASAEHHRRSKVHLGCWATAFWNLLCLAPPSSFSGPQPWVWPRESNVPFVLFPGIAHVRRLRARHPHAVTRSSRTIAGRSERR